MGHLNISKAVNGLRGPAYPYFDEFGTARAIVFWAVSTRESLERWSALQSEYVWMALADLDEPKEDEYQRYWSMALQHHFVFVTAKNVIRAITLAKEKVPGSSIAGLADDAVELRKAIGLVRDVLEHWEQHMPVFNVHPRQVTPKRAGEELLAINDEALPYMPGGWGNHDGPYLSKGIVTEAQMTAWITHVIEVATTSHPLLSRFVPKAAESRWGTDDSGIWPLPPLGRLPPPGERDETEPERRLHVAVSRASGVGGDLPTP